VTLDEAAAIFTALPSAIEKAQKKGLERAAKLIAETARDNIGNYQGEVGPFAEWQELSGATLEGFDHPKAGWIPGKRKLGYATEGEDNPLLRDGKLRESIGYRVEGLHAEIGSPLQLAVWQEEGTPDALFPIPARSFLGAAGYRKAEEAVGFIAHEMKLTVSMLIYRTVP
jgi:hypothetical protein